MMYRDEANNKICETCGQPLSIDDNQEVKCHICGTRGCQQCFQQVDDNYYGLCSKECEILWYQS